MNTNNTITPNDYLLPYPDRHNTSSQKTELAKLASSRKKTWIQLDSTNVQTRFRLRVNEIYFQPSDTHVSIHNILRNSISTYNLEIGEDPFCQFYLVAQPNAEKQYYNITEYIQRCIAGDESVAERLLGRTVLLCYQSDEYSYDLLSESGVKTFIQDYLLGYIDTYGTDALLGFSVEIPRFLSVFEFDGTSIPWSISLLDQIPEDILENNRGSSENIRWSYIPYLFYDKYNSAVIRSVFWQELTLQFAQCFLGGVSNFCHQHGLRSAVSIRESAKSLQYELGTLRRHVDCPILVSDESETSRRLVVAKSVCSNAQDVGILRNEPHTLNHICHDAVKGFNRWISNRRMKSYPKSSDSHSVEILQVGNPVRPILMLSPTQSLWMKPDEKQWNSITKAWGWLCQTVWDMEYDFNIVPEGQLNDATIDKNAGTICLYGENYSLILIPSCLSLHETTVKCLSDFTKAKGRIIVNAPVPYLLNGKIGLEPYLLERLIYSRRVTVLDGPDSERETEIRTLLRKWVTPVIFVYIGQEKHLTESVQVHHRVHGNSQIFFLHNKTNEPIDALVEIAGEVENIKEQILETAKQKTVEFWHANGYTYLKCMFETKQGRLFYVV